VTSQLAIQDNTIVISGIVLLPSRFTVLVNKHLSRTSHTKDLEHQAEAVVEAGLPDEALEAFV
jgi:hypothetical protein